MKKKRRGKEGLLPVNLIMLCMTAVFVIVLLFPLFCLLSKAFFTVTGEFAGFQNYVKYFSTPALTVSIKNTMVVSSVSASWNPTWISVCLWTGKNQDKRETFLFVILP